MWLGSKFTSLSDTLFKSLFKVLFRYDIFISYARTDGKEYALKLRDQLKQLDFSCFLDYDELPAGNSLNNTLKRALKRSATLIVVGTERATKSQYVALEVNQFAGTGRAIIPIDIEGTLNEVPWSVVKERDLVWIDEVKAALTKNVPSPNVADSIDKLFKYTRRNSRVRAQVFSTIILFVIVVAASLFLIQQKVKAANVASAEAEHQKTEAKTQEKAAGAAKVVAEAKTAEADARKKEADDAVKKLGLAQIATEKATAEAKRQEAQALASAKRAKAQQAIAEERTQYVRAQQMGVQSDIALRKNDDLEGSVLLSVESLKRASTPEGYSAWARGMELLPQSVETKFKHDGDNVSAIAYSPDGHWFAQGSEDGLVTVVQTSNTDEPIPLPSKLTTAVKVITFGHDGSWVAAASTSELRVWDVKKLKLTKSLNDFAGESIAFSPDGRYVAMANRKVTARVLDTSDWSVVAQPSSDTPNMFVMCVAFSPDSRWLATGIRGGKLAIWDVSDFNKDATLLKPGALASFEGTPFTIAFSPQGNYIATSDSLGGDDIWAMYTENDDKTVSLKKVSQEQKTKTLPNGKSPLVFSPDESYIAITGQGPDNPSHIITVRTGLEMLRIGLPTKIINAVAFSPDEKVLATAAGDVSFFRVQFGAQAIRLAPGGVVHSLAISPGGQWLVTATANGVRVFQTTDWSQTATLQGSDDISGAVFSPDGRWLAAQSKGKVAVFETTHWTLQKEIPDPAGVSNIGFSLDGRWLITTDSGPFLRLFEESGSWREVHLLNPSDPVRAISFSPDGRRLAVWTKEEYRTHHKGDFREEMYVWNIANGQPMACVTEAGEPLPSAKESRQSPNDVSEIVCSDVRGDGQKALLSEARTWKESLNIDRKSRTSNDGRWLAEPTGQGVVLNSKEGNINRQVTQFKQNDVNDLIFTPDGRWLVIAADDLVTVWPLKPADMIAAACARLRRHDLTADEWKLYISGEKLQPTCSPNPPR